MFNSRNFLSGKRKYLLGIMFFSFIYLIYNALNLENQNDFYYAKREVLLRRIGHEILLQSGDSTSRVFPIKKISENEFQIRFEKEITFKPNSLISITRRYLKNEPLSSSYIVNVLNCENLNITYGFVISKNKKEDLITCVGRKQPKACYMINVKFQPTETSIAKNAYLLGSLIFFVLVCIMFLSSFTFKFKNALPYNQDTNSLALSSMLFDLKNKKLIIDGKTISLTGTEARLLKIFASSPNQTIERSRLQKEIWEDDGVIVGRSLDMFISKLRKKLEADPNIKIVVIRNKGYKLQINTPENIKL